MSIRNRRNASRDPVKCPRQVIDEAQYVGTNDAKALTGAENQWSRAIVDSVRDTGHN
jgi:hypothetical protein